MALLLPLISASLLNASCTNTCAVDASVPYRLSLSEDSTQNEGDSHGFSHPIRVVQPTGMCHNQDEG
jgi:hypothetical protein